MYYILDHRRQPLEVSMAVWSEWMASAERHVALDERGDVQVSTVFLGLDHNHWGSGPPILFETMVFGGPLDGQQQRYTTWRAAEHGHRAWVERALGDIRQRAIRLREDA